MSRCIDCRLLRVNEVFLQGEEGGVDQSYDLSLL